MSSNFLASIKVEDELKGLLFKEYLLFHFELFSSGKEYDEMIWLLLGLFFISH